MESGILYIATGEEYINQAVKSAEWLIKVMDYPVAIIADRQVQHDVFDHVIIDSEPTNTYIDKARNLSMSPFEKTVFIDTDAYVLRDISELFELLDGFDLAAAVDPNEAALRYRGLRYFECLPDSVPEYNTGVLVYKKSDEMQRFLRSWVNEYSEHHHTDQVSFRKALFESSIEFTALSSLYNCLLNYPMQVTGEVKIVHDVGQGSLKHHDEPHTLIRKVDHRVNQSDGVRVLHSSRESTGYPLSTRGNHVTRILWLINKVLLLTIEKGVWKTAKIVYKKFM